MLAKRIIACLDIKDGRVVKGIAFENLRDAGDPVECAQRYSDHGIDEIVFLDIGATREGRRAIFDVVERTARHVSVPLTVGGGVRTEDDVRDLLSCGADKVSINTAAIQDPTLVPAVSQAYGVQAIVVAIDAKRINAETETPRWGVFTHGGQKATGLCALDWATKVAKDGAGEILLTSMDRDGTRSGFDVPLTKAVAQAVSVPVIASGGVGTKEHFRDGLLAGASAVLAASVFHDRDLGVGEVKAFCQSAGLTIRPVESAHG